MKNIMKFKMNGAEDLRVNLQRHIDSGDIIFVGDLTPDWILGMLAKKVKSDNN